MISLKIDQNSDTLELYQNTLRFAFPKLKLEFSQNEINLALLEDGKIIGGITLERFDSLYADKDISKHWFIQNDMKALKMKRLWVRHKDSKTAQLNIFESVIRELEGDEFLYGLLSFNLRFAKKLNMMLMDKKNHLKAKVPLINCDWDESLTNSSEGHKLIKTYMLFGAYPLGDMSGCEEDSSVRLVMGINYQEFDIKNLWGRYA
tara:strand:+ start:7685 stop:8299 length:615 start_codon:yes stop_codon:yes gene_type:complete